MKTFRTKKYLIYIFTDINHIYYAVWSRHTIKPRMREWLADIEGLKEYLTDDEYLLFQREMFTLI